MSAARVLLAPIWPVDATYRDVDATEHFPHGCACVRCVRACVRAELRGRATARMRQGRRRVRITHDATVGAKVVNLSHVTVTDRA